MPPTMLTEFFCTLFHAEKVVILLCVNPYLFDITSVSVSCRSGCKRSFSYRSHSVTAEQPSDGFFRAPLVGSNCFQIVDRAMGFGMLNCLLSSNSSDTVYVH